MYSFGKSHGGGRRDTGRCPVAEQAVVSTRATCSAATVVDVSISGARLRGGRGIVKGEDLLVRVGKHHLFGTVRWVRGALCGIEFDEPLSASVYEDLREKQWAGYLWRGTLDRKLAMEDWDTSLIR
jgi:hypothetical protein